VYGRRVRRVLLVAAAAACVTFPSAARPQAATKTASGTLVGVSIQLQIVSQANGEKCGLIGGTLHTEAGGTINFGAGGNLTSEDALDPSTQALVDTLREGDRLGSAVVATITYLEAGTLCGYPGTVVTGASLRAVPAQTATPTPPGPITPRPTPQPTTRTVSGIVTRMSAFGQLIRGSPTQCEMWPGILKTDAGPPLTFAVMTPLIGRLDTTGLQPADPEAFKQAKLLQRAYLFGARAPVTMTYTGPVNACGYPLEAVVTTATVAFPSAYETKPKVTRRGRVTRLSGPSVVSGNGSTCQIWRGSIKTTSGVRMRFSVETRLAGAPRRPADRRAVKTVRTLRRALAKGRSAVTTITLVGSVIACGKRLGNVVTRASIARAR
jgi:hypothetical protein